MICPDCLEGYEFIRFDVDAATLEHRGVFRCACSEALVFPEFITKELIDDEDIREQLRISRRFHLQRSLAASVEPPARRAVKGMSLHHQSLTRYLEDFSEKSVRLLK